MSPVIQMPFGLEAHGSQIEAASPSILS
jgi:hypothetical protein